MIHESVWGSYLRSRIEFFSEVAEEITTLEQYKAEYEYWMAVFEHDYGLSRVPMTKAASQCSLSHDPDAFFKDDHVCLAVGHSASGSDNKDVGEHEKSSALPQLEKTLEAFAPGKGQQDARPYGANWCIHAQGP